MRRLTTAALLCGLAALAGLAEAAPPPASPFLRLEATMHTARVRKLVVDAARERVLTASDDKTVRLWQFPRGRLLRVMRVPIGDGFEGRVYAADMHPNGRTVAAGGWTGWDFEGSGVVYLFDADSGELTRRIEGFPETIGTLGFSPDGRFLAVGLLGAQGLRILRAGEQGAYVEVARDTEYGDRILDLGYAADGRLVVASLDGLLRLYDAQGRLVGRRRTVGGQQPLSVKFSPDGELIAVGFNDAAAPAVYRAQDLSLAYGVDASALRGHKRLQNIQWSDDGQHLYATGEQDGAGSGRIHRWGERGRAAVQTVQVAAQRPGSLWPLRGGRMAFSSEDPLIGVLHPDGRAEVVVPSDLPDLRAHAGALRVSADARTVEFNARLRLDLAARSVTRAADAAPQLAAARAVSPALRLVDGALPSLNGTPLALDDYELLRSSAVLPGERALVLGTEWSVRAFDARARQLWRYRASGVVWQVVPSPDGRSVVAAVGDGTLRWLRADDGAEYLAAYVHPATLEWIAWTPQGYYVSSTQGDQHIGWHLNRGAAEAPLFYRAVQFERLLYRPDVVDAALAARHGRPELPRRERAFDVADLRRIAPPLIRLVPLAQRRVRIEAQAVGLPMRELAVYVNNLPVVPARARALAGADARRVRREMDLDLTAEENVVRVEIHTGESLGVQELVLDAPGAARARTQEPGDLYVLAVGVNRFERLRPNGQSADLDYAARDAVEVARFFEREGPRHFRKVHLRLLADDAAEAPTRERIVRALDFLREAGARDTVLVFLASHGISDARGNYYFVPADATTGDWNGANGGLEDLPSLLHGNVFFDALRQAAGRRVLMVDTCHARGIESRLDLHSLAKRSASSVISLLAATKGNETSQEFATGRHGLFTYALLQALRSASADRDGDGLVSLAEAFEQLRPIVDANRHRDHPQTPQLHAPWPLDRTVLVRTGGGS